MLYNKFITAAAACLAAAATLDSQESSEAYTDADAQETETASSPFRCCAGGLPFRLGRGSYASNITAYGVRLGGRSGTAAAGTGGRMPGYVATNTFLRRSIRLLGSTTYQDAEVGWYLFPSPQDNSMTAVVWDADGCASYDWTSHLPLACVGHDSGFPIFRDTVRFDVFNTLLRYKNRGGQATTAINRLTCMPYYTTLNLTDIEDADSSARITPGNFRYQARSSNSNQLSLRHAKSLPAGWTCDKEGYCGSLSGYISMVHINGTALPPPEHTFGYPDWCTLENTRA